MTSPGALTFNTYYHIYNRGVNRENIFLEERNYAYFWNLYEKYIDPVADTFAYCLLKNHFHVLVRTKSVDEIKDKNQTLRVLETLMVSRPDPSRNFSNFFNAYAKGINKTYGRTGSLFQHPFGRVVIADDRQFAAVVRYIHQNPQKHGFVPDFREWPYSSYDSLLNDEPTHLQRDIVLDWFGGRGGYSRLHTEWVKDKKDLFFSGKDD